MTIQELQQKIINNSLDNIYVFTGEEIVIQDVYINKIAESNNLEIKYVDSFEEIYNNLGLHNLLDSKKLYVILYDLDIIKEEKVWQNIKLNGDIIIFKYINIDKRNKFFKYFENKIVEFNKLSTEILIHYIQGKDLPRLSTENCKKLIKICGNDYNRILLEINKIKNYDCDNLPLDMMFDSLEKQGAFYKEHDDILFIFIDKVLTRDICGVYKLKNELEKQDESNLKILSLLYNSFRTILLIQSCNSKDICKTTGLPSNLVYYNKNKINNYSINELVDIVKLIQKVEEGIKTGKIDESISLDYTLVNIL